MTRELKLALIVGFSLVLAVTVLISDHLSKARQVKLAEVADSRPQLVPLVVSEPPTGTIPSTEPPNPIPTATDPRPAPTTAAAPKLALNDANSTPMPKVVEPPAATPTTPREGVVQLDQGRSGSRKADPHADLIAKAKEMGYNVTQKGGDVQISPGAARPGPSASPFSPSGNPPAKPSEASGSERTYTVVEGDNLTKIAKKVYGDGNAWKKLAAANADRIKGDSVRVGMKLRIPDAEVAAAKPAPTANTPGTLTPRAADPKSTVTTSTKPASGSPKSAADKPTKKADKPVEKSPIRYASYTVQSGDTLHSIARRLLGSASRAEEVRKLNETVVDDEDSIRAGMVLKVPQS